MLPGAAALSAAADAGSPQQQAWQQQQQQAPAWEAAGLRDEQQPLPEDPRWLAVSRAHAAYLSYMQQLAAMAVSKQQQQHQLVYQVRPSTGGSQAGGVAALWPCCLLSSRREDASVWHKVV